MLENKMDRIPANPSQLTRVISVADFTRICRTCLKEDTAIYPIKTSIISDMKATELLSSCAGVQFDENYALPENICNQCLKTLYKFYRFRKECLDNEHQMKLLLQYSGAVKVEEEETSEEKQNSDNVVQEKPYKCDTCPKRFITESIYKSHMKYCPHNQHSSERYKCEKCPQTFGQRGLLRRHVSIHHEDVKKARVYNWICEMCGKTYRDSVTLEVHRRMHRIENQLSNTDLVENGFQCEECGKLFVRVSIYQKHLEMHKTTKEHSSNKSPQEEQPVPNARANDAAEKPFPEGSPKPEFLCHYCAKLCTRRMQLLEHLRSHTGEKPFTCHICKKPFARTALLKFHLYTHTDVKPYKCKVCAKTFRKWTQLVYHKRTHTGEKPYECRFCGKQFSVKSNLTVHLRRHTGERPYVCRVCPKDFYDSATMKKHEATHNKPRKGLNKNTSG